MDMKDFADYQVAQISTDDVKSITELEQSLSNKVNKPIVLIAYQPDTQKQE